MFYNILRYFVRLGLRWYVPDLETKDLERLQFNAPSIILSNHPNSLFDALVLAAYAPVEIRYLVRGDLFRNPVANFLLRSLYMLPIFKGRDDPEFTVKNDFTFDECVRLLAQGKHILIFPEGRSENLWKLRPFLNGGIVSLLERAYRADIPVQIQPYVLNYSSFQDVPKAVLIKALPPIDSTEYIERNVVQTAVMIHELRERLLEHMDGEVPLQPRAIPPEEQSRLRIPARIGYYTQFWFYKLWRNYVRKKTIGTIFYDSILFTVLLFTYPVFVFLCSWVVGAFLGFWIGLFVFLLLPTTAYCMSKYQKIKVETDLTTAKKNSLH